MRRHPLEHAPAEGFDLIVADLSFISLTTVLPALAGVADAVRDGVSWDLRLLPGTDSNQVAWDLMQTIPLVSFSTGAASLSDIFFRKVGVREGETTGQGA